MNVMHNPARVTFVYYTDVRMHTPTQLKFYLIPSRHGPNVITDPITSDSKRLGNNIWFVQNNAARYGLWSVINAVNEYCKRWWKHTHYYTFCTAELPCALSRAMCTLSCHVWSWHHKQLVMSRSLFIVSYLTKTPVTTCRSGIIFGPRRTGPDRPVR